MTQRAGSATLVANDPGCVKTLRGIIAPGILGPTVTRRAKKRKNLSSGQHYDQIGFRFLHSQDPQRSCADHICCDARAPGVIFDAIARIVGPGSKFQLCFGKLFSFRVG